MSQSQRGAELLASLGPDEEWLERDRRQQEAFIRQQVLDAYGIPQELRDRWDEIEASIQACKKDGPGNLSA